MVRRLAHLVCNADHKLEIDNGSFRQTLVCFNEQKQNPYLRIFNSKRHLYFHLDSYNKKQVTQFM